MKNTSQSSSKNLFILNERKNLTYMLKCHYPNATKEDIEDVVQVTLIKGIKFYDASKNSRLLTYLMTIASNAYIDILRKGHKKHEYSENDFSSFEHLLKEEDFSETFCHQDGQKNLPQKLFSGFENDNNVKAFYLSFVEDKNYEEVAIIQNVSNAVVRKRIQRARKLLQERYQQIINN